VTILDHLPTLERALVEHDFPPMSPWWAETLARFYGAPRRQLVLRVGRRGGKSSTLCRLAVLEAMFGEHRIPPGDVGVVAIVSVSRDEGAQRLRTVKAILDALKVGYRPIDGGIELVDKPVAFKVYTASIAGVSGFTAIAVIADEVAKWRDADTGSNPASEVLASLRPTMATQKTARIFLSSSPLGSEDAHAVAFDQGESAFQSVAYAPTWEANPQISEAETHELEPDERKWKREYLAEPQAGALAAYDADQVEAACKRPSPAGHVQCSPVLVLDPSAGQADTYAFAVVGWSLAPSGGPPDHKLVFRYVAGFDQPAKKGITSDQIADEIVRVARAHGCGVVHADQFEKYALASVFHGRGIRYVAHDWTAPLKERAVERVRQWLRDGVLVLPGSHERMRKEMLAFQEKISPSGALTFRGRSGSHDDYSMLVVLAGLLDVEQQLHGSPLFEVERRAYREKMQRINDTMVRRGLGSKADEDELAARQNEEIAKAMRESTQPAFVEKTNDDFFDPETGKPRKAILLQRAKVAPPMPLGDPIWGGVKYGDGRTRTDIWGKDHGWSTRHR